MPDNLAKLILDELKGLRTEVAANQHALDKHILEDIETHKQQALTNLELIPILDDIRTAKKVGGWVGKILNTKWGAAILLAAVSWFISLKWFN